jgi:Tuberculosis necrotizing toxin
MRPGEFAAPGAPWTLGPGVSAPVLWTVVEAFVGDLWPNGNAGQIHAAATCWRTFGAAVRSVKDAFNGPNSVVGAQQIVEGALIEQQLSKLGTDMVGIGAQCDKLAAGLDDFADDVQRTQDAVRDLLHRLGSASGLWHEVVEVFEGHGLDEVKKIAADIKAVLHHLMQQAQAREQMLRQGMQMLDGLVRGLQIYVRAEITHYVGEDVGNPLATAFDTYVNVGEGVFKGAVGMAEGFEQLNPLRFTYDSEGAKETWKNVTKGGVINHFLNPEEAVHANEQTVKGLLHLNDWSQERPGLGAGENLFDIATLSAPGLGEAGAGVKGAEAAGAASRAANAAGAAGAIGRGGRALGEAGELGRATGTLSDISKTTSRLTKDLKNIKTDLPKTDPALAGRPTALPPAGRAEPPVGPTPRSAEPAPTLGDQPTAPAPSTPEQRAAPSPSAQALPPGAAPSEHLLSTNPQLTEPSPTRVPAAPGDYPAEPAPASAHSLQVAPMSPPHGPIPAADLGRYPPEPVPPPDLSGKPYGFDAPGVERHDPVHSHEPSGNGWERLPDEPRDPYYGEPLPDHWEYPHNPADPDRINSDLAGLIKDPETPFGRDPQGHAYTQEQYEQRFNKVGPEGQRWYNYASDDGAVSGSKVAFNDVEQYKKFYGEQLDRVGGKDGRYLAVMEDGKPAPWEYRSLHVDSMGKPYHAYTIDYLPDRWKIEVSEIEPAVGQPGGALQVRILNSQGEVITVKDLSKLGILR